MKKQQGFGIVQVLLIIVIIGMIGATGYYVWQNRNLNTTTPEYVTTEQDNSSNTGDVDQYDDGTGQASYTKFIDAEEALQLAIKQKYIDAELGCQFADSDVETYVDLDKSILKYKKGNSALVNIGCDGQSAYLFVFTGEAWKEGAATLTGFSCVDIDKYKVSKDVMPFCEDANGAEKDVVYE